MWSQIFVRFSLALTVSEISTIFLIPLCPMMWAKISVCFAPSLTVSKIIILKVLKFKKNWNFSKLGILPVIKQYNLCVPKFAPVSRYLLVSEISTFFIFFKFYKARNFTNFGHLTHYNQCDHKFYGFCHNHCFLILIFF